VELRVIDHPLVAHKLALLRDEATPPTFRQPRRELVTLLAYEATDQVRVETYEVTTPLQKTTGVRL
jgi:uracil phosphoribosyltransferase